MRINKDTLMFEDLLRDECKMLYGWGKSVVLNGHIPLPHPEWVLEWMNLFNRFGRTESELLVLSTVLPLKVLLSVAMYHEQGNTND